MGLISRGNATAHLERAQHARLLLLQRLLLLVLLRRQDIWEVQRAARWCLLLLRYNSLSQYGERVCLIDRYAVIVSVLVYWLGWLWLERSIAVGVSLASPHTARPLVICRLSELNVALGRMSRSHYSATKPRRLLMLDLSDNTACATTTIHIVSANGRAKYSLVTPASTLIVLIRLVCLLTIALVASTSSISSLISASVLLLRVYYAGAEGRRVLPRLLLSGLIDIWSAKTTKTCMRLMLWNA